MEIFNNIEEVKNKIASLKEKGYSIGFVPTMGALHDGHIALVQNAKKENNIVVCSIYINPLQFNSKEDFTKYPRLLADDTKRLEKEGCDIVFTPDDSIIKESISFDYNLGYLNEIMEGAFRPGHFSGVAYIVKTLFEIINPDRAYFGEKDYQQLAVIKKMTKDFNFNIEIIPFPTVREKDGLALSSRNARLLASERLIAPKIYEGLNYIKNNILNYSFNELKQWYKNYLENESRMKVEYVEICDSETLKIISDFSESHSIIICTAVNLGNVRLIDNLKIIL